MTKPNILAPWQKDASLLTLPLEEDTPDYCPGDIICFQAGPERECRKVINTKAFRAGEVTEEMSWRANPEGKSSPIGWFEFWARWELHTGHEYNPDSWLVILEVEKWQHSQD